MALSRFKPAELVQWPGLIKQSRNDSRAIIDSIIFSLYFHLCLRHYLVTIALRPKLKLAETTSQSRALAMSSCEQSNDLRSHGQFLFVHFLTVKIGPCDLYVLVTVFPYVIIPSLLSLWCAQSVGISCLTIFGCGKSHGRTISPWVKSDRETTRSTSSSTHYGRHFVLYPRNLLLECFAEALKALSAQHSTSIIEQLSNCDQ